MRILCEDEIRKPPEVVFPWIAEPEKAIQWQKNVKQAEIIIDRPERVGTTFKEEVEEDGSRLEMRGVITGFIQDQVIAFHLESKVHTVDVSYSLAGGSQGTRVAVEARINWKFPMNLLSIFLGGKMKTGIAEQLKREIIELKRICE